MTQQAMAQLMERIFEELRITREDGQKEYAHANRDAFSNFNRLADDLEIPREAVLWVLAMKHRDGIASWIKGHRSQREDVRGRIKDLIVYLCLLWGMVEEEEANTKTVDTPF
jgi:hypothetical protein